MLRPLSAPRSPRSGAEPDHLAPFTEPFVNPGALAMRCHVPPQLAAGAPLVVVLHGCTQSAAGYDRAAGWSPLADRLGFALLFPEQGRANNGNGCFNWFEPGDIRRGAGEAASIAAAVRAMTAQHRLDPTRVFVTGLSAGGAMANVMLATYPDVFAGGAVIAGLPFGVAHGVGDALAAMSSPPPLTAADLARRVRRASTFAGPWPVVSVWHGGDDRTVSVRNGMAVAAQWGEVHGATSDDGRRWRNAAGVTVVEFNRVDGMGHGTPIDSRDGGVPAPFMLDVGIASSARIAAFWGLGTSTARPQAARSQVRPAAARPAATADAARRGDPGGLIATVLRAAGLMN